MRHIERCGRARDQAYRECDRRHDLADDDEHEAHDACIKEANEAYDRCVGDALQSEGVSTHSSEFPPEVSIILLALLVWAGVAAFTRRPFVFV